MTIFGSATQAIIKGDARPIAALTIGGMTKTLPVVDIPSLTHNIRQQTDCSLDGKVHILTAPGGVTTCQISVLDCINPCANAASVESVLAIYRQIKEEPGSHKIVVTINKPSGAVVTTFEGYINGCTAKASISNGSTVVIATLTASGIWK